MCRWICKWVDLGEGASVSRWICVGGSVCGWICMWLHLYVGESVSGWICV